MRDDQRQRLEALNEKLMDVFFAEAEPDNWPGGGVLPKDMDSQTRGDRYWCKKNAAATLSLCLRTITVIDASRRRLPDGSASQNGEALDAGETGDSVDKEIDAVEKEAARLMAKLQKKGMHPQA